MNLQAFELKGDDGKLIRGDRLAGENRQMLFITGFLSKRWATRAKHWLNGARSEAGASVVTM